MLNSPTYLDISIPANGDVIDATLFIVPLGAEFEMTEASEAHTVLGTDGSAVTLDLKRCTGTQTPAQGTSLLSSTFDLKGAINTVVRKIRGAGLVSGGQSTRTLRSGDRLCMDVTGTPTSVAGIGISITLVQTRKATARGR